MTRSFIRIAHPDAPEKFGYIDPEIVVLVGYAQVERDSVVKGVTAIVTHDGERYLTSDSVEKVIDLIATALDADIYKESE